MEADADALAARTLGRRPVELFLERVLALTEGQNWTQNAGSKCCNNFN